MIISIQQKQLNILSIITRIAVIYTNCFSIWIIAHLFSNLFRVVYIFLRIQLILFNEMVIQNTEKIKQKTLILKKFKYK